jgi:bifunctional non-homologous end joining protein LigD
MSKQRRGRKIFLDYIRNNRGATSVAAYSTRARPGAPVSAPVAWEELTPALRPAGLTVATLLPRLAQPDPWAEFGQVRQGITEKMRRAVGA